MPNEGPAVRLAEVVGTLSLATDLGLGQAFHQGLRSNVLAVRLAYLLGFDEEQLLEAYYLPTLRFVGCTADSGALNKFFGNELTADTRLIPLQSASHAAMVRFTLGHVGAHRGFPARAGLVLSAMATSKRQIEASDRAHCEVSRVIASRLGFGPRVQHAVGQAFERWDGKGDPGHVKGDDIDAAMRVAHLAYAATMFEMSEGRKAALEMARDRAGSAFDPHMVDMLVAHADEVFATNDDVSVWDEAMDAEPGEPVVLTPDELDEALRIVADFVDLKSLHMAAHSTRVSELAGATAATLGMAPHDERSIRHAGLLHDIGRVGVSNVVWNKPDRLEVDEWEQVRLHTYYTERILSHAGALASLADLAAAHHERLSGDGYHRRLAGPAIEPGERILAAADMYVALTSPRCHRPALDRRGAVAEIEKSIRRGRLDATTAEAVIDAAIARRAPVASADESFFGEHVDGLTDREVELLRLIALGRNRKVIAGGWGDSVKAVDATTDSAYRKIDVSTRAAATMFAMQHRLVSAAS